MGNWASLRKRDGTQFTSVWDAAGRLKTTSSGALTYIYSVFQADGARQAFGTPGRPMPLDP